MPSNPHTASPTPSPDTEEARQRRIAELRQRVAEVMARKRQHKLASPHPPPRYDDVFFEGLAWLDTL